MTAVHCDGCEREAPPYDQLYIAGWYASSDKSVSGIPNDLFCFDCTTKGLHINARADREERKRQHDERLRAQKW